MKGNPSVGMPLSTVAVLSNPLRYAFDKASQAATQFVVGDPDRPPVDEDDEPGLEGRDFYSPAQSTFANGMHAVVVETDPETAEIRILRYCVVHDCGNVINPMIVEGQVHGGVAQGVGGALYERMAYDADGQLLNASFMDFLMPYATEVPETIEIDHLADAVAAEPARHQGRRGGRRHPRHGGVRVRDRGRRGLPHLAPCRSRRATCSSCGAASPRARSPPSREVAREDRRHRRPARPGRPGVGGAERPRRARAHDPRLLALEPNGPDSYRMTVTAGVASDQGRLRRRGGAARPAAARVVPAAGVRRRCARDGARRRARAARRRRRRHDGADVRRRRRRRRHGRRRRAADARRRREEDRGGVLQGGGRGADGRGGRRPGSARLVRWRRPRGSVPVVAPVAGRAARQRRSAADGFVAGAVVGAAAALLGVLVGAVVARRR